MIPVIMLLVFLSAIAPFAYATHEAGVDATLIAADAAQNQDSLKEDFHRSNLIRRAFMALGFAALFTGGLVLCGFRWWFLFPYLFFFATAFGYSFTFQLTAQRNAQRKANGEPELPEWHVSTDPRAAVSDRILVKLGAKLGVLPVCISEIIYKGFLIAGFLAFAAAVWLNVLIIRDV